MHLIFKGIGISIELDVNPSATIGDVINILRTNDQLKDKEIGLLYKQKLRDNNDLLSTLGVVDNEVFIIKIKQESTQNTNKPRKKGYGLPARTGVKMPTPEDDPPTFANDVLTLNEMGFPVEDCERALRVSFYNLDRACLYLVNGNIPDRAGPEHLGADPTTPTDSAPPDLNSQDIETIRSLAKEIGINEMELTQIYVACKKNVEDTRRCALDMGS